VLPYAVFVSNSKLSSIVSGHLRFCGLLADIMHYMNLLTYFFCFGVYIIPPTTMTLQSWKLFEMASMSNVENKALSCSSSSSSSGGGSSHPLFEHAIVRVQVNPVEVNSVEVNSVEVHSV